MRKIFLTLCFAFLINLPVQANPVTIPGIGEVDPGQNITVTEVPDKKGAIDYAFKIKDGQVWRSAKLMPFKDMLPSEINDVLKLDRLLDLTVEKKLKLTKDFLEATPAKLITLGGKECATASVKMDGSGAGGIIANMEILLVPSNNGLKLFMYMCADSDATYWRPIMQKITAAIP